MNSTATIVEEIWEDATRQLRQRLGDRTYDLWFAHLRPQTLLKGVLTIGVPNPFIRNWLADHYQTEVSRAIEESLGTRVEIDFHVDGSLYQDMRASQMEELSVLEKEIGSRLGQVDQGAPDLDDWIEIPGNRLVLRACARVIEQPGTLYNPLFFFGSEGCGKSDLLRALVQRFKKAWPEAGTLLLTLDQFKNRFIYASRKHLLDAFRDKLQSLDLLAIDDVHTVAGRPGTQNELCSLLRFLLNQRKQVIISSRVHPNEIAGISETLKTYLLSGMSGVMERPSSEELVAVLKAKARSLQAAGLKSPIPEDVLRLLAQSTSGHPKKAVSALQKIVAYAALSGRPVSVELMTQEALAGSLEENRAERIQEKVEELITWHFKVNRELLYSKRKFKSIQQPRRLCMYLLRECAELPTAELARMFGNRSQVSALSSVRRVEHDMAVDPGFRGLVQEFTRRVREEA